MLDNRVTRYLALGSSISSGIAGSVLAGFFLGRFLDHRLGTYPWFNISGILLGLTMGVVSTVQILRVLGRNDRRE